MAPRFSSRDGGKTGKRGREGERERQGNTGQVEKAASSPTASWSHRRCGRDEHCARGGSDLTTRITANTDGAATMATQEGHP